MFLSLNLLEEYSYTLLANNVSHNLIPWIQPKSVYSQLVLQAVLLQFENVRTVNFMLNAVDLSLSVRESRGKNIIK